MNTFKRFLVLFVAGFCLLGLNAGSARAATVDVTIDDAGFHPSGTISIHKGDTVRWTNTGTAVHEVVSGHEGGRASAVPIVPDGFVDSGPMAPGAVFEQIFPFHGSFIVCDKNDEKLPISIVDADNLAFISPESSNFTGTQGINLEFHFNNDNLGLQGVSQCSISFDGAELGSCGDILVGPIFWQFRGTYILSFPLQLLAGRHSLSIKGVTVDGQAFSDTVWYTVTVTGACGAGGC